MRETDGTNMSLPSEQHQSRTLCKAEGFLRQFNALREASPFDYQRLVEATRELETDAAWLLENALRQTLHDGTVALWITVKYIRFQVVDDGTYLRITAFIPRSDLPTPC